VVVFGVFNNNFLHHDSPLFNAAWIVMYVVATLYSYSWDISMDWGLGDRSEGFLRRRLMYPSRTFYCLCAVLDLFGRCAWTLTFLGAEGGPFAGTLYTEYLNPVLAAVEILRRTMWSTTQQPRHLYYSHTIIPTS
jgi:hypothetical protein